MEGPGSYEVKFEDEVLASGGVFSYTETKQFGIPIDLPSLSPSAAATDAPTEFPSETLFPSAGPGW